eukprot:scaffold39298_cov16-Prasinocladus_malaysianus.AAC.1
MAVLIYIALQYRHFVSYYRHFLDKDHRGLSARYEKVPVFSSTTVDLSLQSGQELTIYNGSALKLQ